MERNTSAIILFLLLIAVVIGATIAITSPSPFGAFSIPAERSPFTFSCTDSDNGYEPYQPGNTYGMQSGSYVNYTDTCITETLLKEYYCSGSTIANTQYDCSRDFAICVNSACEQV